MVGKGWVGGREIGGGIVIVGFLFEDGKVFGLHRVTELIIL